jgi:hypothetical protein
MHVTIDLQYAKKQTVAIWNICAFNRIQLITLVFIF